LYLTEKTFNARSRCSLKTQSGTILWFLNKKSVFFASFYTPLRLCVTFFTFGQLVQNQIVQRENKNPDQINQVPVKTGIFEDDKVICIHLVVLDQKHSPEQEQGTNHHVQAVQAGGQVVDVEKDHFAGLQLFKMRRSRVNTVTDLGAPFKVFVDHEDNCAGNRTAEQSEAEGFGSTSQGGD
jgi:hypothetical protein